MRLGDILLFNSVRSAIMIYEHSPRIPGLSSCRLLKASKGIAIFTMTEMLYWIIQIYFFEISCEIPQSSYS